MYKNGQHVQIIVDNYFPCRGKEPCFSRANGKELWVLILEKAWAKIHGSYSRIIGGTAYHVLRDLLGAPSYYHRVSDGNAWELINTAVNEKAILCCSTIAENTAELKKKGIQTNHSYGLLNTAEVIDNQGNKVRLLKLRNPWGTFEWQGDWGDLSDKWTPETKK